MYKKFRGPLYTPGSVAEEAKTNENFDQDELLNLSSDTSWQMPSGIRLYHFPVRDTDSKPVVAIHGGPCIPPMKPWKMQEQVPGLYLYHARGCGNSTHPFSKFPTQGMWPGMKVLEETLGFGAQIGDVERIRRRLGVEKLSIVGHSFGGLIATLYAAEFPQHVESLVLLAPASCLTLPAPKGGFDFFEAIRQGIEEKGNSGHLTEYQDFISRYFDFSNLPKETDESLAALQNEFAVHYNRAVGTEHHDAEGIGGMAAYAGYFSMGMEHDYVPALQKMLSSSNFPVQILHGSEDFIPPSESQRYADLFPAENVKLEVVNAGHFLYDDPTVIGIVKECVNL